MREDLIQTYLKTFHQMLGADKKIKDADEFGDLCWTKELARIVLNSEERDAACSRYDYDKIFGRTESVR